MPPERYSPADPREWLNRARSNLAKARARSNDIYLEDLCFDAQQAAEKAIKALLIHRGIPFPHVHDLKRLLDLAQVAEGVIPQHIHQAARLTRFAVADRYPGTGEPVTEQEYAEFVAIATAVLGWVEHEMAATS